MWPRRHRVRRQNWLLFLGKHAKLVIAAEACRSPKAGMRSSNWSCWAHSCCSWCCWYCGVPNGAPRTMRPCSVVGRCWLPTHTLSPNPSRFGGLRPAAFHTRVLPVFSCMCALWNKWCDSRSKTGRARARETMV